MWFYDDTVVREHAGFVGGWCPLCNEFEYLSADRLLPRRSRHGLLSMSRPLAGLSDLIGALGSGGWEMGVVVTCIRCRAERMAEDEEFIAYVHSPDDTPVAIARRTLNGGQRRIEQTRAEFALAQSPTAPTEARVQHIVRAIRSIDFSVHKVHGPGGITFGHAAMVVLAIMLTPVPFVLHHAQGWSFSTFASILAPVICLVGLVWQIMHGGRGYARRRVSPRLARAIAPINPSVEEIQAALDQTHLKTAARRLRANEVWLAVHRSADDGRS